MVIITSLDEKDNMETHPYTEKEPERTTPSVEEAYWQWQQPPSYHQWGPPPPPADWHQPYSSWASAAAAGYYWQSDQASRPQWYDQSFHVPPNYDYYRSQYGAGMSGPTPDQQWHYCHPSGGPFPWCSYGSFVEEPPPKQAYNFCERPQQGVHSTSFPSSRDTMFENFEPQQHPNYDFYQRPQQGVNPTPFASARDATSGNDKEYLWLGPGNMNMAGTSRLNTTTANTPAAGPSRSRPTASHMPGSSRTKPMTSEMPMANIPCASSSTPRQKTMASPAGNKESLDDMLTRELKHIVKQAIGNLMEKSNREGGVVFDPTPIRIVLPEEDEDNRPPSPEVGELALEVVEEEPKTQKKQRAKTGLVGIEHLSFSDRLPEPVMQSINDFTSKWKAPYKYTLVERLNGWRLERKQRVNARYDSYYYHEISSGFFRSVIEISRFVLREERPSRR
ncbi:hypothetical protein SLEP1_g38859 [Rubroshorea leprosula]|uniref:Uncharacterized protein n=1 Tax=Rubroshorea leprosula TaxID=152421 RepID=A0AAV5KYN1_9ROSI|nr:hypothetical protein SLEP1_g38859 [Rubroshorea leprosula]